MKNSQNLEERALAFATMKHGEIDHRRKYTNEPYIEHPKAVAEIVRTVSHTEEMIAAALLHDTVEDTNTTLHEINEEFGAVVAELVEMLTDVSKPEDGSRKVRKRLDRQHTARATPEAKTIKLADLIHNSQSILEHDPEFAKVYMAEKQLLLDVLKAGNQELWKRADRILRDYRSATRA